MLEYYDWMCYNGKVTKFKGFLEKKIHTRNALSISNVLKVNDWEKTLILEQLFGQYLKDFYDFTINYNKWTFNDCLKKLEKW